ncbi:MAG: ATP-binding protein [Chloroflexota bacterium]|nr:ATP-binding protein [Chloroflexota bacterium]MDE2684054.1 ATP-binding protein [Chloroflexota bacterium]
MANNSSSFEVGIEFSSVLAAISKQIYDTPYAFLRENLQNAIDASRMQARRRNLSPGDPSLRIDIEVQGDIVRIRDRGIGMSSDDLRHLYWTIGASGKRTEEARAAGCVGMFGIGGFANLGVCEKLVVISQAEQSGGGNRTELGRSEIDGAIGLPQVALQPSTEAFPRGTIVEGVLTGPVQGNQLRQYIEEIVRYCREPIYFNDNLISGEQPGAQYEMQASTDTQTWAYEGVEISGKLFKIDHQTLGASLEGLSVAGEPSQLSGALRFEGDGLDIRKQGFKLCAHTVNTRIGVSGFIDCDLLSPTAGRDSLNAESGALVAKIVAAMEREAVLAVLESSELIEQHTRIFRYVRTNGLVGRMGNVVVQAHGGFVYSLDEVKARANSGAQIYFGAAGNAALTNVLHSRGHIIVYLPSDNHKAAAIREFLGSVGATDLKGQVEFVEQYTDLSRFEKAFLAELSETISSVYQVNRVTLTPGRLTEDIPIYVANPSSSASTSLRILVDVRHEDVAKLAQLGITSLFRSMVSAFCREYLGLTLRSRSPKFFGSGAVNLDWLAKNRSETWILLTDDIAVVNRAVRRDVVRAGDVRVVTASPGPGHIQPNSNDEGIEPKLVKIVGAGDDFAGLEGYYLRIPNSASVAYGDVIVASDDHGAVWMGNKILLLASDGLSSAFQFEVRLDRLLLTADATSLSQGAVAIEGSIQQLFGGLYFPLPHELEDYLVPTGNQEIRIEVLCDWLDFASSRSWEAREVETAA